MSETRIRALLVEDSEMVARFLLEVLTMEEGDNLEITRTPRLSGAAALLEKQEFDVILLDLSLPDSHGMDTVDSARQLAPRTPILVLSSADDETTSREALRHGAEGYLVKGDASAEAIMAAVRRAIERTATPRGES